MPLPLVPILWGLGAAAVTFVGAQVDAHANNGGVIKWLMKPFEKIGEQQREIANEVGAHSMYETLDQIGEFLAGILGRNAFTDGIRNFAQKMQGIPEGERQFGTEGAEVTGTSNMIAARDIPASSIDLSRPASGLRNDFDSRADDRVAPLPAPRFEPAPVPAPPQ